MSIRTFNLAIIVFCLFAVSLIIICQAGMGPNPYARQCKSICQHVNQLNLSRPYVH